MTNYFRAVYYLHRMMKSAYWSHNRLLDYQEKRLRRIVKYAYHHVPFYHKKFREIGIKPSHLRTAKDLNKLPVMRKDEIKKSLNEMISKEFSVNSLKMLRTSGSTGIPLHFYISGAEDEFRKAKHLRANLSCGQRLRDRWVVITAPQHQNEATRLQRFLGIYVPTPVSVFDDTSTQVSVIEDLKPDILDGYSSSLLLLAKEVEKRGIWTIRPRFIIGGAELIDNSSRQFIEKVFDAPFYDQYACVETERIAWQCPERAGYHVDSDSIIMQFVDEDGEEVSSGERGEIVCTSLFNYAMPLLRYNVGDVGMPLEEAFCPCGRTFPLMKVLEGRKDSFIVLPDGRILSPLVIGDGLMLFKFYRHIDKYRVVQKKIDVFKIFVKKTDDDVKDKVMEAELSSHVRKILKASESEVTIETEFVDDIPLDRSGKLMKVVSELKGHRMFA